MQSILPKIQKKAPVYICCCLMYDFVRSVSDLIASRHFPFPILFRGLQTHEHIPHTTHFPNDDTPSVVLISNSSASSPKEAGLTISLETQPSL